jgi:hypothetical protein
MVAAKIDLGIGTSPGTPVAGIASIFFKNDKKLYIKDDAGLETQLALGGVVGPANTVYVELAPKGNDATGTRGDASLPFASIKAGLAACQDGDCLRIGPGTFTIADVAEVPAWPAGVNRLIVEGAGAFEPLLSVAGAGTRIVSGGGTSVNQHVFNVVSTATGVTFRDLTVQVTAGTGRPIRAVGAGTGFMLAGLALDNVNIKSPTGVDLEVFYANIVFFNRVLALQGGGVILNTSNILLGSNCFWGNMQITWDAGAGANMPTLGRIGSTFRSCQVDDITLTGEPDLHFVDCDGEGTLESSGVLKTTEDPRVNWNGGSLNGVDFLSDPWTGTGVDARVSLTNVVVSGDVEAKCDGGGVMDFDIRNCSINSIVSDDGVTMTCRASSFRAGGVSTPGTGTFTPDFFPCTVTTDAGTPATVSFGITAAGAPTQVRLSANGTGLGDYYPTAFTASGFDLNWSGGAGAGVPVAVLAYWEP